MSYDTTKLDVHDVTVYEDYDCFNIDAGWHSILENLSL